MQTNLHDITKDKISGFDSGRKARGKQENLIGAVNLRTEWEYFRYGTRGEKERRRQEVAGAM